MDEVRSRVGFGSELSVNEGWMDEYMNEQNIVQNFPGLGIN